MRCVVFFALFSCASCATLANEGEGDRDLPSVGVGPFRKLTPDEQRGTPPAVFDDAKLQFRDPAVLTATGDPHTTELYLYVTGNDDAGKDVIYRTHANDGRTFYGTSSHAGARPAKVLSVTHAWEGAGVRAPSMLREGAEIWMYYAADRGIGLARSQDGIAFTSSDVPVLALAGAHGPSVAKTDDGVFHLFYEIGRRIFESTSSTGTTFAPGAVVLEASPPLTRMLEQGEKPPFDAVGVGDPCASVRTTAAGRLQFRVLYTGIAADKTTAIGFAARYGTEGPLQRNTAPVFSSANGDVAPALFEWIDPSAHTQAMSMLYATEGKAGYPAIGAAVAPVTADLGMPAGFPDSN